jgi:hypothetical protein
MRRIRAVAVAAVTVGALSIALAVGYFNETSVTAQTGTATTGTATNAACPAPPQGNHTPPAHANGTIASISGTTFTLTGQNNTTYTITTDGNTHYDKTTTLSVGAIAVGDMVMAQGTTSGRNFAATTITDNGKPPQRTGGSQGPGGPPHGNAPSGTKPAGTPHAAPAGCKPPQGPGGPPPGNKAPNGNGTFVAGTVQTVSGTTLTLKTRDGKTVTVTTDGNTKVTAHATGAFSDLKVGDQIDAMADPKSGTASGATSFTATHVSDRTAH